MPPKLEAKGKVTLDTPLAKGEKPKEYGWVYVNTKKTILGLLEALGHLSKSMLSIDIETYPKKAYKEDKQGGLLAAKSKIRTLQIYNGAGTAILDFTCGKTGEYLLTDKEVVDAVFKHFEGSKLVAHNALFETEHLHNLGVAHGIDTPLNIFCTMNAYRLIIGAVEDDAKAFKATLQSVAKQVLNISLPKEEQASDWLAKKLTTQQLDYCCRDAVIPYLLLDKLVENLAEYEMLDLYKLNTKAQDVVAHMNVHGFTIDEVAHDKLCEEWDRERKAWGEQAFMLLNKGKECLGPDALLNLVTDKVSKNYKDIVWKKSKFSKLDEAFFLEDFPKERDKFLRLAEKNLTVNPAGAKACKRVAKNISEYLLNINSGTQLSSWLKANVNTDGWPMTESGNQLKTDADTFEQYSHLKEVKPLLEYKKYEKLYSVYGEGLKKYIVKKGDGRSVIHPNFSLCYTETGRMSSTAPNCQNWPNPDVTEAGKAIRSLVIPRSKDYVILNADFSQIELRIFALISGDRVMLDAYNHGVDLHSLTATAVSGKNAEMCTKEEWKELRQLGKAPNFALLFGGGANRLKEYAKTTYNVDLTLEEAEKIVKTWRETYFEGREWQEEHTKECEHTLTVRTKLGKVRKLTSDNYYTCSLNTPIQGSAAEVMLLSMVLILKAIRGKFDARIINVVHDEINVECHISQSAQVSEIMKSKMEEAFTTIFPGASTISLIEKVGIGSSWYEAK